MKFEDLNKCGWVKAYARFMKLHKKGYTQQYGQTNIMKLYYSSAV